jgi:hypothetical protein
VQCKKYQKIATLKFIYFKYTPIISLTKCETLFQLNQQWYSNVKFQIYFKMLIISVEDLTIPPRPLTPKGPRVFWCKTTQN